MAMDNNNDDKFMFLEEDWALESEILDVVRSLSHEEKQMLLQSEEVPELIIDALAQDAEESWLDLPRSA